MEKPFYKKWWFWFIVAVAMFVVLNGEETGKVSPEEYNKLKEGMTYKEIQKVVGGIAESERVNSESDSITEYKYLGENGKETDATVNLIVNSNGLVYKSESGLLMTYKEEEQLEKMEEEKAEKAKAEKEKVEEEKNVAEKEVEEEVQEAIVTPVTKEEFENTASVMTGGSFIKTIALEGQNGQVIFFQSYNEYKSANPQSMVTEEDYKSYFERGDKIQKLFISENLRLLRKLPALESVSMTLPFDGKTYFTQMKRTEINDYFGFKIEELKDDNNAWNTKVVDVYVYGDKREGMFQRFVQVK